jgi:methionine synthase I (cobalamin-dependent)
LVQIGDTQYYFDCQHGMSLAFVQEQHVQAALNFLGGCCGGKKKVLSLATETQYKHWLDGNGGR